VRDSCPVAPTVHDGWHLGALVLADPTGPALARGPHPCPDRPLPRTRLLPHLVTDGFCQARLRVYLNHAPLPGPVALRSQTGLTGSGSHRYSYGGFGGGHLRFQPHTDCRPPNLTNVHRSA